MDTVVEQGGHFTLPHEVRCAPAGGMEDWRLLSTSKDTDARRTGVRVVPPRSLAPGAFVGSRPRRR